MNLNTIPSLLDIEQKSALANQFDVFILVNLTNFFISLSFLYHLLF